MASATRGLTVNRLEDMDVYNYRGEQLGEIRSAILANRRHY